MSDIADILERAADLIEPEGRWTQGASYRDAAGLSRQEDPGVGEPVCWCVVGAIVHVKSVGAEDAIAFVEKGMRRRKGAHYRPLAMWNDSARRTQAEVVAKLREAAARARLPA